MSLETLYKEIILEHNKEPRNFGQMKNADRARTGFNPLCGDKIQLQVKLSDDQSRLNKCCFNGEGCSICMASASIMTEEVEGREIGSILKDIDRFRGLLKGESQKFDSDVDALEGVRKFPVRIKCALLAWMALKDILENRKDEYSQTE